MALTEKKDQRKDNRPNGFNGRVQGIERTGPLGVWGGESRRLTDHKQEIQMRGNSKNKANTAEC